MAEAVDSIIAELILRADQYQRGMEAATATYRAFRAELERPINEGGPAAFAEGAKKAAQSTAQAEEQATQRVTRTRKARTDAEIAEAERSKVAERERVAVIKQAVREEAAAVKAAEKEKQAAVAETGQRRRQIEITSAVVPQASGLSGGRNPLQEAAEARGATTRAAPNANPVNLNAEQNAAAHERALAEAEINDRMIAQLGLKAEILAADKLDAAVLQEQLFALRQFGQYKALGLSEADAETRVQAQLLAFEEKRVRVAAEQAAIVEKQLLAQKEAIAAQLAAAADKQATSVNATGGSLVGGLVAALGATEISHLNDRYIELSNSLKVAGVSASEFDAVQSHLLETANKNGTNINALADVFRSASLATHDLGASQADLLKLTDAASNALRIQGVSASQAQGSLLQLGHAFESGKVNAREFNSLSLNLYPILQAAARGSDQFGGSVAKLRAAVVAGTVSSKDFFNAILAGSDDLAARASKATLTTEQGFQSLTNALTVYFGQADQAQGVSAALGEALKKIGQNLDTLIPAIGAVATALTVGYIQRMAAAAIATQGLGASILGAFGGPVGLAITAVTLAIAGTVIAFNQARQNAIETAASLKDLQDEFGKAGKAAAAAGSGVRGVGTDALGAIPHVNAFAGAVGDLANKLYDQARAARAARVEALGVRLDASEQKRADLKKNTSAGVVDSFNANRPGDLITAGSTLFRATANRTTNLLSFGYQDQDANKAYQNQGLESTAILKEIQRLSDLKQSPLGPTDIPGYGEAKPVDPKITKAIADITKKIAGLEKIAAQQTGRRKDATEAKLTDAKQDLGYLNQGIDPAAARAGSTGGRGRAGPTTDTLVKRAESAREKAVREEESYNTQLKQGHDKQIQALTELSNDTATRAALARSRVREDRDEQANNIRLKGPKNAKKDPNINGGVSGTGERTQAQTDTLLGINASVADLDIQNIDKSERQRKASDALSIETANLNIQKDALEAQEGLADNAKERRKIANQILAIEYQIKENALKATLAPDSSASPADRTIARSQLAALPGQKVLAQQALDKTNLTPGQAYASGLGGDTGTAIQNGEVKALQSFNSELDKSIEKSLKLHGVFGSIVADLVDMAIKQALLKPLANALFPQTGTAGANTSSGGFGGLFSSIGKLFGGGGSGGGLDTSGIGAGLSYDSSAGLAALPGLATGGTIGGNGGVDRNVLSINGVPQARIGKGELLSISPNGIGPNTQANPASGGTTVLQTIAVDAKGAVMNDQFASQILSKAAQYSNAVGQASYQSAVKTSGGQVSTIVQRKQTLGS